MAYGLFGWLNTPEEYQPEEVHAAHVGRYAEAVLDLETDGALAART